MTYEDIERAKIKELADIKEELETLEQAISSCERLYVEVAFNDWENGELLTLTPTRTGGLTWAEAYTAYRDGKNVWLKTDESAPLWIPIAYVEHESGYNVGFIAVEDGNGQYYQGPLEMHYYENVS